MGDSTTLVLGAGGASGWMFHIGVLEGLMRAAGWDARSADLVIGTSAGSVIGGALRSGLAPADIAEAVDRPPSDEDRAIVSAEVEDRTRTLRPLSPRLARTALKEGHGAGVVLSGLLPAGMFPTWPLTGRGFLSFPEMWDRLWIPALNADTGAATVFGRDRTDISVSDAIEASCALPGLFQPKDIDQVPHVDGGAISATHADLAIEDAPTLVVISSPLSRPSSRPLPRLARRRLKSELAALEAARIPVLVVEPPEHANQLFKAYPRRNQAAGGVIRAMGTRQAEVAVSLNRAVLKFLRGDGRHLSP